MRRSIHAVPSTLGDVDVQKIRLPQFLRDRALWVRIPFAKNDKALGTDPKTGQWHGDIPVLLAHPEEGWIAPGAKPTPRPVVLWLHGRTATKELDPGRYLRWLRAEGGGLGVCAIDLPGHGERFDERLNSAARWPEILEQAVAEIDVLTAALAEPRWNGAFDTKRLAIGGMSLGGMVAIVRLCREHPFRCAAVESTAGDFRLLGRRGQDSLTTEITEHTEIDTGVQKEPGGSQHGSKSINPIQHLENWRAIPFLALHSEADEMVPVAAMRSFIEALKRRYSEAGADAKMVKFITWPSTGAPREHLGFGRVSNEAKNIQTELLAEALG